MLTAKNLQKIMIELLRLDEIGCTYDFKERFGVSLKSIEALTLAKAIRSRIPACGDHCEDYKDCKWISTFEKRKSKSKFKLTKNGLTLANFISSDLTDDVLLDAINEQIIEAKIIDVILLLLNSKESFSVEFLVNNLLDATNLKINDLRVVARDILDLLESMAILTREEGVIVKC